MNNLKTIQEFLRTPENIQAQQDVFQESRTKRVLITNSRTVLGAQGSLATLSTVYSAGVLNLFKHVAQLIKKQNRKEGPWPTDCTTYAMRQLLHMHTAHIKTTKNI